MKELRNLLRVGIWALSVVFTAVLLGGCGTGPEIYQPVPGENGAVRGPVDEFHVGDLVVIKFADPGIVKNDHEERVKEDGTITPPDVGTIKAAGKSSGELQRLLQTEYNKYYVNMTVTVRSGDRFYSVDGEVKIAGPKPYLGETDVIKAISAAGGFTEFANKKNIRLIHPNGTTEIIDYNRAVENSSFNVPVYPGDTIVVRRRIF